MKTCSLCKISKPLVEFYITDKSTGRRYSWCDECRAKYRRKRYLNNKEKELAQVKKKKKERRKILEDYIIGYLINNPCIDCSESDLVVLDFDHITDNKTYNVSKMIAQGSSLNKLKEEIKKCEVVCSNCHRRRTAIRGNFWRTRIVGREVRQQVANL